MDPMNLKMISPDLVVLWQWGAVTLNLTIVMTWAVIALLTAVSWLVTRRLDTGQEVSRWQNLLEVLVAGMEMQIGEVSRRDARPYLPFIGTLFLLIAFSNLLSIIPGYVPPTGSLSTTAALAICVFVAVPAYSIAEQGVKAYLKRYIRPTAFMLPFQVIGEISRTLALAIRLFGNIMSGTKIAAILLAVTPLFFPVVMQALGLLTGLIQAYIFALLALVYMASASRSHRDREAEQEKSTSTSKENS